MHWNTSSSSDSTTIVASASQPPPHTPKARLGCPRNRNLPRASLPRWPTSRSCKARAVCAAQHLSVVANAIHVQIQGAFSTAHANSRPAGCRRNRNRPQEWVHIRIRKWHQGRCRRHNRPGCPRSRPRRHTPRHRPHPQRSRRHTHPRRPTRCRRNRSLRFQSAQPHEDTAPPTPRPVGFRCNRNCGHTSACGPLHTPHEPTQSSTSSHMPSPSASAAQSPPHTPKASSWLPLQSQSPAGMSSQPHSKLSPGPLHTPHAS